MRINFCKSEYSETWLENGVIHQIIVPNITKINLEIARQLVEDRKFAMGGIGITLPVFVVVNNVTTASVAAKAYYRTAEPYKNISAIAMLMESYFARITGKFIFLINRPKVPTTFFKNEETALAWLKQFKNLN